MQSLFQFTTLIILTGVLISSVAFLSLFSTLYIYIYMSEQRQNYNVTNKESKTCGKRAMDKFKEHTYLIWNKLRDLCLN